MNRLQVVEANQSSSHRNLKDMLSSLEAELESEVLQADDYPRSGQVAHSSPSDPASLENRRCAQDAFVEACRSADQSVDMTAMDSKMIHPDESLFGASYAETYPLLEERVRDVARQYKQVRERTNETFAEALHLRQKTMTKSEALIDRGVTEQVAALQTELQQHIDAESVYDDEEITDDRLWDLVRASKACPDKVSKYLESRDAIVDNADMAKHKLGRALDEERLRLEKERDGKIDAAAELMRLQIQTVAQDPSYSFDSSKETASMMFHVYRNLRQLVSAT